MKTLTAILLMAAAAAAGDSRKDIARKLDAKMSVSVRDARLNDALEVFRDATGLNFVAVDGAEMSFSLTVHDVSARSALNLLLAATDLVPIVTDGAVVIRHRRCLSSEVVLRVYDLRAALVQIQNFPADELGVLQSVMRLMTDPLEPEDRGLSADLVTLLVKAHTGGRSWAENDGCTISERGGLLYVRQTPRVHREIQALLAKLQF